MIALPVRGFNCPSRRATIAYPTSLGGYENVSWPDHPEKDGKSDYAANGGDRIHWFAPATGVTNTRSEVTVAQILDGKLSVRREIFES